MIASIVLVKYKQGRQLQTDTITIWATREARKGTWGRNLEFEDRCMKSSLERVRKENI